MDQEQILYLYRSLKQAYRDGSWEVVEESIEYIEEYIEDDDEDLIE